MDRVFKSTANSSVGSPRPETTATAPSTSSSSNTNNNEGDMSSSIRIMADKHAVVKNQLSKVLREVAEKKKILQALEEDRYLKEGTLCIAEQNLRSVNEKLFDVQNGWKEKEKRHEELVKELVDVQWMQQTAQKQFQTAEVQHVDFQVEKAIREDEVTQMEALNISHTDNNEYIDMKNQIKLYQDYKIRLEKGDEELKRIMSGDVVVEIEQRKNAIRDAFNEREARAEMVYVDIDEKNESLDRLNQSILIKEKQNQARLRKLRKQLQDTEETEKHLKRTAEYLDRQIDPALNNNHKS